MVIENNAKSNFYKKKIFAKTLFHENFKKTSKANLLLWKLLQTSKNPYILIAHIDKHDTPFPEFSSFTLYNKFK